MAQESLQKIKKILEGLGYYSVADLLSERMTELIPSLLWEPKSDNRLLLSTLQNFIAKDDWDAALDILNLDPELPNGRLFDVESIIIEQQRNVALYIVYRFMFLRAVISELLGAYRGDVEFVQSLLSYDLGYAVDTLDCINFDVDSVAFVAKIPRSSEDSILGLISRNPPSADQLESAIFNEKVLLTSYGTTKYVGGPIRRESMKALLGNVVSYHLRSIITPEVDEDGS